MIAWYALFYLVGIVGAFFLYKIIKRMTAENKCAGCIQNPKQVSGEVKLKWQKSRFSK